MARHRAPTILDAGLRATAVHAALTRAERRGGGVNGLRCGRHDNLLSRPSRDVGERGGAHTPRSGVAFRTFFALPTGETQEGFPGYRHWETLHSRTTEAAAL